jgi:hypothetical protein
MLRWTARSPRWRIEALAHLAVTEASSVAILSAAARAVGDRRLKHLLEKHTADEARHARLFGSRCDTLAAELGVARPQPPVPPVHVGAGANILGLFAFLEITELRGTQVLSEYRRIFAGDSATLAVLDAVLEDERFHVAYLHLQLERWVRQGHAAEVASARREACQVDRRALCRQVASFSASLLRRAAAALSGGAPHRV